MVCEDDKLPAVKQVSEVEDTFIDGQQLPVKGAVIRLGGGKLLRKKSQRLPMAAAALLEDGADVCR